MLNSTQVPIYLKQLGRDLKAVCVCEAEVKCVDEIKDVISEWKDQCKQVHHFTILL